VELFNVHTFLVTLSSEYDGPAINETYIFDVLTKEILSKPVHLSLSAEQLNNGKEFDLNPFKERVVRVANIANKRDAERYKHHLFNECMAEAREGKTVTPENYETIFMEGIQRFAQRFTRWQASRQTLVKKIAAGEFRTAKNGTPP
jgi:hypothetical protein